MRKQGIPKCLKTKPDIAFRNTDDASHIKAVLIWIDFYYSKNNCLKGNPEVYKLRRKPPEFNFVLRRFVVNW